MAQGNAFGGMGKMSELKNRLLFLLGALIILRLGAHIHVPGIDPNELKNYLMHKVEVFSDFSICFRVEL